MTAIKVEEIEPGQPVEIDFLRPADAPGVAALFRAVYGDAYPHRAYYEPQTLVAENAARRIISSVARTPKGEIVGHSAVFRTAPHPGLYESGAGLVLPPYRNTAGILTRLLIHGQELAPRQFGVEAIFGDAILNHPFTQKVTVHLKSIPVGLQVDLMPAATYAKEGGDNGRVAGLMTINLYQPHPHRIHRPAAYREALDDLYSHLDDQRELVDSHHDVPADAPSQVTNLYFDFAQVARLYVTGVGRDIARRLAREEEAARAQGAVVVQAWLDLSIPWLEPAVDWLRANGYFLGGIMPRWFDQDALMLQKVLHRPHWEGIVMALERGQEILDLVRRDWERTQT
jgi:hypothetical protein